MGEVVPTRCPDRQDTNSRLSTIRHPIIPDSHFLWIGDRTRQLTGAHIQFFRGIRNPIGLKAGPTLEPEELVRLLDILDPDFEDGKVTIIGRYGAGKVSWPVCPSWSALSCRASMVVAELAIQLSLL